MPSATVSFSLALSSEERLRIRFKVLGCVILLLTQIISIWPDGQLVQSFSLPMLLESSTRGISATQVLSCAAFLTTSFHLYGFLLDLLILAKHVFFLGPSDFGRPALTSLQSAAIPVSLQDCSAAGQNTDFNVLIQPLPFVRMPSRSLANFEDITVPPWSTVFPIMEPLK